MTKFYASRLLVVLMLVGFQFASAQSLVHYWNFNNNATVAALTTPTSSLVPGAALNAIPGGSSTIDAPGGTGQNFGTQNLNARNGDPAGSHLRFNNPIGGTLEFLLPTTGYADPVVKFATRRSGSGAGSQQWAYSLNGTTFINFTTITVNDADPELVTLNFSAIGGADNNPNFRLRVTFAQGGGGTAGNNRFDNFTLDATPTGGDVNPPVATITPLNGATNIQVLPVLTIAFNEAVRLVAGDATLNNSNVDAAVELRLGNAAGPIVPFDATVSGNSIAISPLSPLTNSTSYYVALLPNTIEDVNNNAITSTVSSVFTTIAVQPSLSPGDIAIVGYRMSATGVEDEIAFLVLKTLTPGTVINFTDSKYTTNAQPQCDGGIEWTSPTNACLPAGTVVRLETGTLVATVGTTTGTAFGLSSAGDQVIVYAGTAAAPTYLTALTSNGWIAVNTTCGGSESMLPVTLSSGVNALNAATAPGNTAGNAVNAYYNGITAGTPDAIRAAIMTPSNWIASAASTAPQTWPAWSFPAAIQVTNVEAINPTTIVITFSGLVNPSLASQTSLYTGIDGISGAVVSSNTITLTYSVPFGNQQYELLIGNIPGSNGFSSGCPVTYSFDGSLSTIDFEIYDFTITPNPAQDVIRFSKTADISIFDMTGKQVLSASQVDELDITPLRSGVYLVRTTAGEVSRLMVN